MRAERICTAASDTRIFCACAPVFFCGHARAPPRAFASKAHSTSADRTGATISVRLRVRLHRRARLPARHILRQPTERGATTSVRLRVRVHRLPSTAAATADDCTSCPRAARQAQIRRACAVRRLLQHRGMCLLQHMQDRGIMRAPRVTLSNVLALRVQAQRSKGIDQRGCGKTAVRQDRCHIGRLLTRCHSRLLAWKLRPVRMYTRGTLVFLHCVEQFGASLLTQVPPHTRGIYTHARYIRAPPRAARHESPGCAAVRVRVPPRASRAGAYVTCFRARNAPVHQRGNKCLATCTRHAYIRHITTTCLPAPAPRGRARGRAVLH